MVTELPPVRRKIEARSVVGAHVVHNRDHSLRVMPRAVGRLTAMLMEQATRSEVEEIDWETLSITCRPWPFGGMELRAHLEVLG